METQLLNFITLSNIFSCCFNNNAEPVENNEEPIVDSSLNEEINVIEEPIVNTPDPFYTCERCGRTGYTMPIGMKTIPFNWEYCDPKKSFVFHIHDNIYPVFLDPYGVPFNYINGVASFKSPMNANNKCHFHKPPATYHICKVRIQN